MSRSLASSSTGDASASLSTALQKPVTTTRARASSVVKVQDPPRPPPGLVQPQDDEALGVSQQLVNRRASISSHADSHTSSSSLEAPLRARADDTLPSSDEEAFHGKPKDAPVRRARGASIGERALSAAQAMLVPRERNHHRRGASLAASSLSTVASHDGAHEKMSIEVGRSVPRVGPSARSIRDPFASPNQFASPALSPASSVHFRDVSRMPSMHSLSGMARPPRTIRSVRSTIMRSRMIEGELDKPWRTRKDTTARAVDRFTYLVVFLGIAASIARCYFGYKSVQVITRPLCPVLEDDFSTLNSNVWAHENLVSGFVDGQFDMTTGSSNNSFIKDNQLYIVPTLTSDVIGEGAVLNGYTLNLTGCTGANYTVCSAVSNASMGAVIPPVMSARLTTKNSTSIRYGRVEVRAKIPRGDWIWPSIRMLPTESVYGEGVMSGEIDIMQARGNGPLYPKQGTNYIRSALHWGPVSWLDLAYKTFGYWSLRRGSYHTGFHTYALEWTANWLRVYVDSRLHHTYQITFDKPLATRGYLPTVLTTPNGTGEIATPDPWANATDRNAAPFDQRFYLSLGVAVGGTSGFFPDNAGGKPWLDKSGDPMRDFAAAQKTWFATWPTGDSLDDRALVIDSVKMFSYCNAD